MVKERTVENNHKIGTEYEFSLVEIYDKKTAPENAFLYSRVLFTETTRSPSFIYTAAHPMLQPWMRYAWRVRAVAKDGIDEITAFKNNGYSPIFYFDYVTDCKTVQMSGAVYENGRVKITWDDVFVMEYTVEYRKKGATKWNTSRNVEVGLCTLYNLEPGTEYEYRIGTRCMINDDFGYNNIKGFRIPDRQERQPNCGVLPDVNITNHTPATELIPGEPVMAGDFLVFITKVSGSGTFSGEGYVGIPYLKNAQVAVTFNNIVVNTDKQLISGFFETKYDAVNNNLIMDIDEVLTGGKGVGDIRSGEEKAAFEVDYTINPDIKVQPVKTDDSKDEIRDGSGNYHFVRGENGKYDVIITDSKGNEHKIETEDIPFTITDAGGNTYEVSETGDVKPVSSSSDVRLADDVKETPNPSLAVLEFQSTSNTKYALDQYKDIYAKVTEFFLTYKPTNNDMIASAKFMAPGSSDEIFVKIVSSGEGFNPAKVRFVTDKEKEYKATYDEAKKGWTVTVVGSEAGDGQHLYVVQEQGSKKYATLARLNIYTYSPKTVKVKLLPVNGFTNNFTANEVSTQLNAIYNKVGVTCEVEMANSFNYTFTNGTFNVTGSGLFSTLTNDMKALNGAYMQANPNEDAICLFIIKDVTGNENVVGDMPRGKQFDYLFNGSTAQTIAHEIGHGVFHLDHPFDRANAAKSFGKGDLADNLMEYGSGTNLVKLQWDAIHAPGLVIGLFEKDEQGMVYSTKKITDLFNIIRKKNLGGKEQTGTIVRAEDIYQDQFIKDSATSVSMKKEEFLATLTHEQAQSIEQRKTDDNKAWDNNPIVLANKAHIKLKLDNKKDSVEFVVSINGYSSTDNIFTAWVTTTEDNKMVFYNAIYAKKGDAITEQSIKANRKAFDITIHTSSGMGTFEELKQYLKIKGYIDFSDMHENGIILELNRQKSNDYVTVGELKVKGTDIKFLTLELGRNNSESTCGTEEHDQYLCGRIKAGIYTFELNTTGTAQHRYKSLRLNDVPKRDGILVHRGNAYLWMQGCVLLMIANEVDDILENPVSFMQGETQGFNSSVEYQVPALALYDYIEKYGVKNEKDQTVGQIIITDDNNVELGDNSFTREINYRREAARLYYDNEKSIHTILNNTADSLMKAVINNVLSQELLSDGKTKYNIEKIDSILQTKSFKAKVEENATRDKIISILTDDLLTSKLSYIFAKIQSDKNKVISKFFRTSPTSGPFPPVYYINNKYRKSNKNEYGTYIKEKITKKNIDEYITQEKNKYKK